tara:strand:+ start:3908 stop:4294 length:387 start_codon:yes stop_codon:yes gene_type:complete
VNKKSTRPLVHTQMDILIGQNIKFMRTVKGITLQKVADYCGCAFQQIQKYEKGTNGLSAYRLKQLSDLFQAPLKAFYDPEYIKKMHSVYSSKFFNKNFEKPKEFLDVYVALAEAKQMMDEAEVQQCLK